MATKLTPEQIAARLSKKHLVDPLVERFVRYAKIDSQSSDHEAEKGKCPSTEIQHVMADTMVDEARNIGITTVHKYPTAHVVAKVPPSPGYEDKLPLVLMAHIDTSEACPGSGVKPQVVKENGDLVIKSDGTTLLGADDKAGLAAIVTAVDFVLKRGIPHGQIELVFTPDEETGTGVRFLKPEWVDGRLGVTVDGEGEPEISPGCFNAITVKCEITGRAAHLGSARGKLVNAVLVASALAGALPRSESPETTDGEQGYWCPFQIDGGLEKACLIVLIRDYDRGVAEERARIVEKIAAGVEAQFPGSRIKVTWGFKYGNFEETLKKHPVVLESVAAACEAVGIKPHWKKCRGGTDESSLQTKGFALANIFTGAEEYHSIREWLSVASLVGATEVLIELIKIFASKKAEGA